MRAVCNFHRQRLLVERLDTAADDIAQQPVQAPLLGLNSECPIIPQQQHKTADIVGGRR
jgi:hypothetical protein